VATEGGLLGSRAAWMWGCLVVRGVFAAQWSVHFEIEIGRGGERGARATSAAAAASSFFICPTVGGCFIEFYVEKCAKYIYPLYRYIYIYIYIKAYIYRGL